MLAQGFPLSLQARVSFVSLLARRSQVLHQSLDFFLFLQNKVRLLAYLRLLVILFVFKDSVHLTELVVKPVLEQ